MSDWQPYQTAPMDRPVWMFLPGSKFTVDANGRPTGTPEHEVVLAEWSDMRQHWVNSKTQELIYPSKWSDAPNGGKPPEAPQ